MSMIQFEGCICDRPTEQVRIRSAIKRVEETSDMNASTRWVVVTQAVPLGGLVYVAHAVRRDWTVTAQSVSELEDKLMARADGGVESSRAVQPSPFRTVYGRE
ncbi:hypothetical protein CRI94_07290 [Longibacter salinarum]|uniref:Uncharacterized protein n=1 Tax=Longibacter salinarum TaxID=1850348 RepID=A0A2A8CZ59_9BACT|nr:hypothetical protein [Longibacter salinarum]PEN13857.1 hypothetical protein CRI94_07290 [Longibacter salinarum]